MTRRRVDQVVAHHDHVEVIVRQRPREHRVARVDAEPFGNADEPNLAGFLRTYELRQQHVDAVVVLVDEHAMQMKDVDVVGAETLQTEFETVAQFRRAHESGCATRQRLRRQHDTIPAAADGIANRSLRSIRTRGIDEVDAKVECGGDDVAGMRFVAPARHTESAMTTAAEAHRADGQAGATEFDPLHRQLERYNRSPPHAPAVVPVALNALMTLRPVVQRCTSSGPSTRRCERMCVYQAASGVSREYPSAPCS